MNTMIIEKLDNYIVSLKKLRQLMNIKENSVRQESIDQKYKAIMLSVHNMTDLLNYSKDVFHFSNSEGTQPLSELLIKLKRCVSSGFADGDLVAEAQTDLKKVQSIVKRNWEKYYGTLTKSTLGTLQVISRLDPPLVSSYQARIQAASTWPTEKSVLVDLNDALCSAEKLIQSLNLDEKVTVFLRKMAAGQATVLDLNPDVSAWIHANALEGKIRLSFAAK